MCVAMTCFEWAYGSAEIKYANLNNHVILRSGFTDDVLLLAGARERKSPP